MIKEQGEDAECAAWIYTKNDCHLKDEDGNIDYDNNVEDPALVTRIFDDVGNIDYIYQVIQESVDEVTEEQLMSVSAGVSLMNDFPIYKKQLPQVWLEDDKFIIESDSFRYVIKDDLKLLFKLCRRFKSDAIAQTYVTN